MERQIRPLHPVDDRGRARVALGPVEGRGGRDGGGDVPDGRGLEGGAGLGVVRGESVGAAEVEGAPAGGAGGGGAQVDFVGGDGAVVADVAGGDAEGFLAEGVALGLGG